MQLKTRLSALDGTPVPVFRGPDYIDTDLSLIKTIRLCWEGCKFSFGVQAYSVSTRIGLAEVRGDADSQPPIQVATLPPSFRSFNAVQTVLVCPMTLTSLPTLNYRKPHADRRPAIGPVEGAKLSTMQFHSSHGNREPDAKPSGIGASSEVHPIEG